MAVAMPVPVVVAVVAVSVGDMLLVLAPILAILRQGQQQKWCVCWQCVRMRVRVRMRARDYGQC